MTQNNFELLAQEYKNDPVYVKRNIKKMPTIGRVAYKALVDFLTFNYPVQQSLNYITLYKAIIIEA